MFPKGFLNEVQVVATVISVNTEVPADIPALIGASAALTLSGCPFAGPIGAARVGYIGGEYVLNPTRAQLAESALDLVVAGTEDAVLMVESEANVLSEEVMLGSVLFGHEQSQTAIRAINELKAEAGKPAWEWSAAEEDTALASAVAAAESDVTAAYAIADKLARQDRLGEIRAALIEKLVTDEDDAWSASDVSGAFSKLEKRIVRSRILEGQPRIDGRDTRTVRGLDIQVGSVPRTHGSAIFTRGEPRRSLSRRWAPPRFADHRQRDGRDQDSFMLHYISRRLRGRNRFHGVAEAS